MVRRVIVVAGGPGTGKSRFGMDVEELIEFWDIENKSGDMQKKYYADKAIHRKELLVFDERFHEDWYATYLNLKREVDNLIKLGQEIKHKKRKDIGFQWLVVDGITPIRNKIMLAKWMSDHSKKVTGKPDRKQPNEFEWGDINDDVRELLFPLINMVVTPNPSKPDSGIIPNLLFTSELQDAYEAIEMFDERQNKIVKKSVKVGQEPAYKDYLGYKLYTLLELQTDIKKKKYKVVCTKSLQGLWEADVTGRTVYDVLLEQENKE